MLLLLKWSVILPAMLLLTQKFWDRVLWLLSVLNVAPSKVEVLYLAATKRLPWQQRKNSQENASLLIGNWMRHLSLATARFNARNNWVCWCCCCCLIVMVSVVVDSIFASPSLLCLEWKPISNIGITCFPTPSSIGPYERTNHIITNQRPNLVNDKGSFTS